MNKTRNVWKNTNPDNPLMGTWVLNTNQDGYFTVGKVTKGELSEEIKIGDVVISINGIDLREAAKTPIKKNWGDNVSDLFEENELIQFELMRINKDNKKEIFIVDRTDKDDDKPNIENSLENFDNPYIDLFVKSINVNEKEGTLMHRLKQVLWNI